MHRRIVLSKSLAPFVAVAVFPAAATTLAMSGPALLGNAANEPGKRSAATADRRVISTPRSRRMAT